MVAYGQAYYPVVIRMGTSFLKKVEMETKGFGRCVIVSWWKWKVRGVERQKGWK